LWKRIILLSKPKKGQSVHFILVLPSVSPQVTCERSSKARANAFLYRLFDTQNRGKIDRHAVEKVLFLCVEYVKGTSEDTDQTLVNACLNAAFAKIKQNTTSEDLTLTEFQTWTNAVPAVTNLLLNLLKSQGDLLASLLIFFCLYVLYIIVPKVFDRYRPSRPLV
jgi:hypothetical protein